MTNPTKSRKKTGAPTIKTPEVCAAICEGIALGRSARSMCIEVGISQRALWNWLASDAEFMQQYARAKDLCADVLAEEIIEIADDTRFDKRTDKDGREIIDNEAIQRSRLRVDARKWYASKLAPKKYGEKVVNEHQGGDPSRPIVQAIEVKFIRVGGPPA